MIGHPPKSGRSFNPIMGEETVKTKHLPRKSRCFLCEKSSCVHMGGYTDKGVKETYTYATNPLSPFFHIPINKLTAHHIPYASSAFEQNRPYLESIAFGST